MMRPASLSSFLALAILGSACEDALPVTADDRIPAPNVRDVLPGEGEGEGEPSPPRCDAQALDEDGVVLTSNGHVRGERIDRTWRFRGVRFGAPPTGEHRFAAPREPDCIEGVADALDYGNACPQVGPSLDGVTGDEDCLFLNVWTPALGDEAPSPRPVMFFIHGGGNILGEASQSLIVDDMYDGQALAEETNNVVVTINYRLGALGFLAHPALTARDGASGNAGIRDAVLALQWVRDNVARFGGDPARVMVFGESAGALNTCAVVASPLAAGLFSSALMESGACDAPPLAEREAQGVEVLESLGCQYLECLLNVSAEDLVTSSAPLPDVVNTWSLTWGLTTDGVVLPDAPLEMMKRGEHNRVPFAVGSNAQEMNFFIPLAVVNTCLDYTLALRVLVGDHADAVEAQYPCFSRGLPHDTFIAASTDLVFTCPARRAARAMAEGQSESVFRYHFRDHANTGPTMALGAYHASELFFIFDKLDAQPGYFSTDGEKDLTRQMQRYWGRMAENGDPNASGEPTWARYERAHDNFLILDEAPFSGMTIEEGEQLGGTDCDVWDAITAP